MNKQYCTSHMSIYYNAKERQAAELPGNPLGHVSP